MATVAELSVQLEARDTGVESLLRRVDKQIKALSADDAVVEVSSGGTSEAVAELEAVEKVVERLDGDTAKITVDVDAGDALFDFDRISGDLTEISGRSADVSVRLQGEQEAISGLEKLLYDAEKVDRANAELKVKADTAELEAKLSEVMAQIEAVQANTVNIHVKADLDEAQRRFAELEAEVQAISANAVNLNVDLDMGAAMAKLVVLNAALKETKEHVGEIEKAKLQVSNDFERMATFAQRASREISTLTASLVTLAPALVAVGAVGAVAVASLAVGFGAAAAGVGAFSLAAVTTLSPVSDALAKAKTLQDQYNTAVTDDQKFAAMQKLWALYGSLTPQQAELVRGVQDLKANWESLTSIIQPTIFVMANEALYALNQNMPKLAPLLLASSNALHSLQQEAIKTFGNPVWTEFFQNMTNMAGPAIKSIGESVLNLGTGFAGLMNAFQPFAAYFLEAMQSMTARFAEWAAGLSESKSFNDFIDYAAQNLPKVVEAVVAVAKAIIALIEAAAPLSGPVLAAITAIATAIADLQEFAPGLITAGMAIAGLGMVVINIAGPLTSMIQLITSASEVISGLTTASAALGVTIDMSLLGPIALAVAALLALGYGIAYLIDYMGGFGAIFDAVGQGLSKLGEAAVAAGESMKQAVAEGFAEMQSTMEDVGGQFVATQTQTWTSVLGATREGLDRVLGVFGTSTSDLVKTWKESLDNVMSIMKSIWQPIESSVKEGLRNVLSPFQSIGKSIVDAIGQSLQSLYNAGASMMQSLANGISAFAYAPMYAAQSVIAAVSAYLPGSPAEKGPLSGHGYVKLRGQRFVSDLAAGISDTGELRAAVAGVSDLMSVDFSAGESTVGAFRSADAWRSPASSSSTTTYIEVKEGAVVVSAPSGDAEDIATTLNNAGATLAEQLRIALERR
jgi:hypothetical protein